ncbi:hypothetical protein [Vibrio harveyi]|uniref:hypothetical protein n=1 Tax=Vibrio harveyi TaxID=669 RepID=UPI003BB6C989|nr:hypothetical protein [Vibrio harveyi]
MSIKSEMHCIKAELVSIIESQERIKSYVTELNKHNPLAVGQELVVNGWSHDGKLMIAEKVFVSDHQGKDASLTAKEPINFTAVGTVKRKDGSLGSYTGVHNIKIETLGE